MGHYDTFEKIAIEAMFGHFVPPKLDEGLTRYEEIYTTARCQSGCRKVFQSKADRDRHNKLMYDLDL